MSTTASPLSYPIGHFVEVPYSDSQKESLLSELKNFPKELENLTLNITPKELLKSYRANGWNVQQLVHHLADSHLNLLVRIKLAITENNPTIKPYNEKAWAQLPDMELPISLSVQTVKIIHEKVVCILHSLQPTDWNKTIYHPDRKIQMSIWYLLGMYVWHGKHHKEHIKIALKSAD